MCLYASLLLGLFKFGVLLGCVLFCVGLFGVVCGVSVLLCCGVACCVVCLGWVFVLWC